MPTAIVERPPELFSLADYPKRKRWTRSEVQRLIREGHHELEQFELFNGELIDKMSKGRRHVKWTHRIASVLEAAFGQKFVQREGPINLRPEDHEYYNPEPDIAVLTRPLQDIADNQDPDPSEILLVVEVADSSITFDRVAKAKAYAAAGIQEYWVADIAAQMLLVFRAPGANGYDSLATYTVNDAFITTVAKPDVKIDLKAIL